MSDRGAQHARSDVATWVAVERRGHADVKWQDSPNRAVAIEHMRIEPDGEWYFDYVRSYLHRASLLGLDSQPGRQALGKAVVTALHALETAVEVHGEMPEPGLPSGEIRDWT